MTSGDVNKQLLNIGTAKGEWVDDNVELYVATKNVQIEQSNMQYCYFYILVFCIYFICKTITKTNVMVLIVTTSNIYTL